MTSCFNNTYIPLMLALLFPVSSAAEEAGKPLAEKLQEGHVIISASVQGCDEDIKQHCNGLGGNASKVFMCLMAYEDQLSPACRDGILEAAMTINMGAEALDYSITACEADADAHCRDVQPGEGRIVSCLKANASKVSNACIAALQETGLWKLGK
jgi:hypothetical protein